MDDPLLPPEDDARIIDAAIISETDAAQSSEDDDGNEGHDAPATNGGADESKGRRHRHQSSYSRDCCADTGGNDEAEDEETAEATVAGPSFSEELYCENMDDEDEAWVYKNMRGGREEKVHVRQKRNGREQGRPKNHHHRTGDGLRQQDNQNGSIGNPLSPPSPVCNGKDSTAAFSNNNLSNDGDDGIDEANTPPSQNEVHTATNQQQSHQISSNQFATTANMDSSSHDHTLSSSSSPDPQGQQQPSAPLQQALLLKPRASDAVLSCPRCFTIVCMDCQRHKIYAHQFRAMFVMNIGVDWQTTMVYDKVRGGLLRADHSVTRVGGRRRLPNDACDSGPDTIPRGDNSDEVKEGKELYYSVHCIHCQLEVAALDMGDEVYHFFGCIASC